VSCLSPDHDFGLQRSVNRTTFGNLNQALLLRLVQRAGQLDFAIDAVQEALFGFAFTAIFRMNPVVAEAHRHTLQIPLLALRVQA